MDGVYVIFILVEHHLSFFFNFYILEEQYLMVHTFIIQILGFQELFFSSSWLWAGSIFPVDKRVSLITVRAGRVFNLKNQHVSEEESKFAAGGRLRDIHPALGAQLMKFIFKAWDCLWSASACMIPINDFLLFRFLSSSRRRTREE